MLESVVVADQVVVYESKATHPLPQLLTDCATVDRWAVVEHSPVLAVVVDVDNAVILQMCSTENQLFLPQKQIHGHRTMR